ncbi:hypothetical protein ES705_28439 [subsurface metagenome]
MKSWIKTLCVIFILTFFSGCEIPVLTRSTVTPLGDHMSISSGSIIYSLPQTTFHIEVTAKKTVYKQGPYFRYAEKYLGITEKFPESSVKWTINHINISSYEEIDPDHYYVIESDGFFETNALAMTKAGLILTPNPEIYNKQSTLNGLVSERPTRLYFTDLSIRGNLKEKVQPVSDVLQTDTALFLQIPVFMKKEKIPKTTEEKAREVADFINNLKTRRLELLGDPYDIYLDGGGFEYIIEEMKRLEKKYTALFIGISYSEVYKASFGHTPDENIPGKPEVLFRFSDNMGILPATDITGRPVVIELNSERKTAALSPIIIEPFVLQGEEKPPSVPLYYRIPDVVEVRVVDGRNILANKKALVYQFGKVVNLPSNFLIKEK